MLQKILVFVALVMIAAAAGIARGESVVPVFDPVNFTSGAPVDNRYFPLSPGDVYRYEGTEIDDETGESIFVEIEDYVTFDTRVVAGIQTTQVRAREWKDGLLIEDTFDWYAQDNAGNVWYMGEDVTNYFYDDAGNLTGTDKAGSFEAGKNGAKPGYQMLASPKVGDAYFQEVAPADGAYDEARVASINETVQTDLGRFAAVVKNLEFTQLDPDNLEHKLYAPGIGLVLIEEGLDENGEPGFTIPLISKTFRPDDGHVVPMPSAVGAGIALMALIALRSRRRD